MALYKMCAVPALTLLLPRIVMIHDIPCQSASLMIWLCNFSVVSEMIPLLAHLGTGRKRRLAVRQRRGSPLLHCVNVQGALPGRMRALHHGRTFRWPLFAGPCLHRRHCHILTRNPTCMTLTQQQPHKFELWRVWDFFFLGIGRFMSFEFRVESLE